MRNLQWENSILILINVRILYCWLPSPWRMQKSFMKYTRISITKQDCSMQQREVLTKILEYLYKMPNTVKSYTYTGANSIFHNFLEMPSSLASWTHWPASWPACWSSPSLGTWHTSRRQPSMMWSTVALDLSSSHILIWYFFAFWVFNFLICCCLGFIPPWVCDVGHHLLRDAPCSWCRQWVL